MTTENKYDSVVVTAGADFTSAHLHKAIAVAGTVAANSQAAIGLLKSKPASGDHAQVGVSGAMKFIAGGAITAGVNLNVTTSGFIITAASATGVSVGKALEAGNSGDLVKGLFNFANAGAST